MELKIKRVHPDAVLPNYANHGDAGLDLYSVEEKLILPGETVLIDTGIQIALPENTEAQIRPRSGLALKHSITLLNTPGTIDYGYRGNIGVIMINHSQEAFLVKKQMKIAQMVIAPVLRVTVSEAEELSITARGAGGFGSSGI